MTQLRRIAKIEGVSPRELIEKWIVDDLKGRGCDEAGVPFWIPPAISAYRVRFNGIDLVAIESDELPLLLLRAIPFPDSPRSEVEAFADGLDEVAGSNRQWAYRFTKHGGYGVHIFRQGGAAAIEIDVIGNACDERKPTGLPRLVLSPPLTYDLGSALRHLSRHPSTTKLEIDFDKLEEKGRTTYSRYIQAFDEAW